MIEDDYSDNAFEDDYESTKPKAKPSAPANKPLIKKDFWDPPKSTVVPAALSKAGAKVEVPKKGVTAAEENDYEDDDFDEDEEENFKVLHLHLCSSMFRKQLWSSPSS